jgi:Secretion system C-terminal sorting domain
MKKLLLLFTILLLSFHVHSQIVNIPDPVFKNVLVNEQVADLNGNGEFDEDVDTNNDGEIQVSEAEAVLGLSILANVIESLEGIEYFTSLTFLRCVGNLLTELDVSALVHLEILKCYSNNIDSINVNGLTQLSQLWVAWNQMENIDLSTLQNLYWIYCTDNQLNSLDVSGLYNLEAIWADSNAIPSIDLTDNTLLFDISLSNNLLSSIEVNFLQNLQFLNLSNNLLTEIDVSNLNSLVDFKIGYNNLTELDCSTTGVQVIHCENNPNLSTINVQNGVISHSDPDLLYWGFYFYDLPSLEFICMDPGEWQALSVSGYDPANVVVATGPDCTLGIEDISSNDFSLYPNPVNDELNLRANEEITSVSIHNVLGQELYNSNVDALETTIDLSNFAKGTYIINVTVGKDTFTRKLIKE